MGKHSPFLSSFTNCPTHTYRFCMILQSCFLILKRYADSIPRPSSHTKSTLIPRIMTILHSFSDTSTESHHVCSCPPQISLSLKSCAHRTPIPTPSLTQKDTHTSNQRIPAELQQSVRTCSSVLPLSSMPCSLPAALRRACLEILHTPAQISTAQLLLHTQIRTVTRKTYRNDTDSSATKREAEPYYYTTNSI